LKSVICSQLKQAWTPLLSSLRQSEAARECTVTTAHAAIHKKALTGLEHYRLRSERRLLEHFCIDANRSTSSRGSRDGQSSIRLEKKANRPSPSAFRLANDWQFMQETSFEIFCARQV
jgi:hypothetical protein